MLILDDKEGRGGLANVDINDQNALKWDKL